MPRQSPYPGKNSKAYAVLKVLLAGERIDPIRMVAELNLVSGFARVSELRKLGWPVQTLKMPHPILTDEDMPVYTMDAHFLRWFQSEVAAGRDTHPYDYPFNDGRGKHKRPGGQHDE